MLLTNVKIEVTHSMMSINNMTRVGQYGIPADPKYPNKGLVWKSIQEMEDEDFDKLEEYFIAKRDKVN